MHNQNMVADFVIVSFEGFDKINLVKLSTLYDEIRIYFFLKDKL